MSPSNPKIAPWLLKAKVTPPRQLMSVIERTDLIDRLDRGAAGNLIILEAPGGYGKSCLLTEWRNHCIAKGESVCWLSVDEDDDPETFIAYLAFAGHVARIDTASSGLLSFEFSTDKSSLKTIFQLLAHIERVERPVRLVIDDYERLSDNVKTSVLPPLLRRLPENATVVIASRETVELSTVDLDHRGLVTRLGTCDLRFGDDEMATLWKGRLTPRQIDRLAEQTEGWPVLIRLLLSASDIGSFDIRHIDEISYNNNSITTYFEQKILSRIDIEVKQFLIEGSIFAELSQEAIIEVLGYDGDGFFDRLHGLEAFLAPLSDQTDGYRLHPMMREYLRRSLEETDPDRYRMIQAKAAKWYSVNNNHVRAVKHALEADDHNLLLAILDDTGGLTLWLVEGLIEFRAIDRYLTDDIIDQSPTSALMRVIILMKSGKQAEASTLYERVTTLHEKRIESEDNLTVSAIACRIMLAVYRGDVIEPTDAKRLDDLIRPSEDLTVHFFGFFLTMKCVMAHQSGNFVEAIEYANKAIGVFSKNGSIYGEVFIHLHLAMIYSLMADGAKCAAEFGVANDIMRRDLSYDGGIKYLYDVLYIEAMHERDPFDLKQTNRLKNVATRLLKSEGWIDIYAGAFRTLSEQIYLAGDSSEAMHVLNMASHFAERNDMVNLYCTCRAQKSLILCLDERYDEACQLLEERRTTDGRSFVYDAWPWRAVEADIEAWLLIAIGGGTDVPTGFFKEFRDCQFECKNIRSAIRLSALLALVSNNEEFTRDLEILETSLRQQKSLRPLLFRSHRLAQRITDFDRTNHCSTILELTAKVITQQKAVSIDRIERESIITDKERAVLRELRTGLTDKQIALKIGVTEHAIRYHLKNIFPKLGAKNRTEAASKAEQIGVL